MVNFLNAMAAWLIACLRQAAQAPPELALAASPTGASPGRCDWTPAFPSAFDSSTPLICPGFLGVTGKTGGRPNKKKRKRRPDVSCDDGDNEARYQAMLREVPCGRQRQMVKARFKREFPAHRAVIERAYCKVQKEN